MSNNSFKVKNSLVLTPRDLSTLTNPEAGDIACDIVDGKIKRYDPSSSSWITVITETELTSAVSDLQTEIDSISASNVGTGADVFKQKTGSNLEFKTLKAGQNIQLIESSDEVTITASGSSQSFTTTYDILDNQTNTLLETITDKSKAYDITYSVNRSVLDTVSKAFSNQIVSTRYFPGDVNAVLHLSNGKTLVGGAFTGYLGQTGRDRLILLNADGTEDTVFTANAVVNTATNTAKFSGSILCLAERPDGKIVVGGAFSDYAGQPGKSRAIVLNPDGTEDTAFSANGIVTGSNPKFSSNVAAVAVQSDNKVIFAGSFLYNSTPKRALIRLNADGTEDLTFSNNAVLNNVGSTAFNNGSLTSVAVQPDGKIITGGTYNEYNKGGGIFYTTTTLRFDSDGNVDTAFCNNLQGNTGTIGSPRSIALQSDGKIVLAGSFRSYFGSGKNFLIRLNSDGTEDSAFSNAAVVNGTTANFGSQLNAVTILSDGGIVVGGAFANYKGISLRNRLLFLNSDGTENTAANDIAVSNGLISFLNVNVNAIAKRPDDKILIGTVSNLSYKGIISSIFELLPSGEKTNFIPASTFSLSGNATIFDIAVQPDGKILVGGAFTFFKGATNKNYLVRLNADGTEDTAFTNNAVISGGLAKFNNTINAIRLQSDGKILVGGQFTNYGGQTGRDFAIRLNADGTEDTAFTANAIVNTATNTAKFNSEITAIGIQSSGRIIFSGSFTNYAGQPAKNRIIGLNPDGTEDMAFTTNAVLNGASERLNGQLSTIQVQADQKIIIGGLFTAWSGQTGRNRLIRLNSDGTEDTAFTANATVVIATNTAKFSSIVNSVSVGLDGKILVGGAFTAYNGATGKNFLIRLNSDGTEDTAFNANATVTGTTAKFSASVSAVFIQEDGKCLIGGSFSNYGGQTGENVLIRLNADGTEDTVFSAKYVANASNSRFSNAIRSIAARNSQIFLGGSFVNYVYGTTFNSFLTTIENELRVQIGKLFAIPANATEFSFSTPTTHGTEASYPTGVTMEFNTDGTIRYSSTTLNNSEYAIDQITIEKKFF